MPILNKDDNYIVLKIILNVKEEQSHNCNDNDTEEHNDFYSLMNVKNTDSQSESILLYSLSI